MGYEDEGAMDDGMVTRPDATHLTEHERNALKEKFDDSPTTADLGDDARDQSIEKEHVHHK
jgi:hypothetical protein